MPLLDSSSGPRGSESIAPFLIRASTTVRSASQNFNQIQKASFDGFWSKFAIYPFFYFIRKFSSGKVKGIIKGGNEIRPGQKIRPASSSSTSTWSSFILPAISNKLLNLFILLFANFETFLPLRLFSLLLRKGGTNERTNEHLLCPSYSDQPVWINFERREILFPDKF